MRTRVLLLLAVSAALFAAAFAMTFTTGCQGTAPPSSQPAASQPASAPVLTDRGADLDRLLTALRAVPRHPHKRVCTKAKPGRAACHARIRTHADGMRPMAAATPQGLGPVELQSAYAVPQLVGAAPVVAIVDAQDNPKAEADLATYRSHYGLPACTTANGCFRKVNQTGKASPLPKADSGWSGEISLDLDMVSAICPACKILLVEANSASMADLGAAVNAAVKLGATVVSNSYGGSEDSSISSSEAFFNHPGVAIFVSAGDSGYGAEYPASSAYVTAVGGTSLVKASNARGWSEAVWGDATSSNGGTGSGCSAYVPKPVWQKDAKCTMRTVADVAAVADPNTGVSVYDSYSGGWNVFGGTSAASPIVAAIYAVTGRGAATPQLSYSAPADFFDVVSGTNGDCGGTYLCTAGPGYDGPTGNGTPNAKALGGGSSGCTPACAGRQCGGDNCGGTCGTCAAGQTCSSTGTCAAAGCTPVCAGKACGPDGCTGTCGTCAAGATCSAAGQCVSTACAHGLCAAGPALAASCDPCAAKVCASDSFCCATDWDSQCVSEVGKVCGAPCATSGTCAHSECSPGVKLSSTCSACAAKVCARDGYCCATAWDNTCTAEVKRFCGPIC